MKTSALLRLVTAIACTAIVQVAAIPAQARSDWINQNAPHWLDQTIYRPDCLLADCPCACRFDRVCLAACMR
jgi:hypothetical protein